MDNRIRDDILKIVIFKCEVIKIKKGVGMHLKVWARQWRLKSDEVR